MLSIGTLVAYTMVAIAVLVTRYTPEVESVAKEKDTTNEKTSNWLQSICCRPGETDGQDDLIPDVSYHQVENNDEDSSIGTTQPDDQTSFRVRVATFVLTLSITAFTVCITRANAHLVRREA